MGLEALTWLQNYRKLQAKKSEGLTEAESTQLADLESKIAVFLEPKSKTQAPPKRQSLRVDTSFEVNVSNAAEMKRLFIKNISGGGLYIESPDAHQIGQKLELKLKLPNSQSEIELKVEIAWLNPKGVGDLPPGVGVKYLNLSEADRRRIQALIESKLETAIKEKVE